ncbi:hypothetical protein ACFY1L_38500 [Streptomyces sp. NPDC001663]|uniref:hypothetical protein n=1 Tax=Streptomyces sp. NPDC001663 TaxID=3364597 RepID=UPI0036B462FE
MDAAGDTSAVTNLLARYAELVDDGDFAGVGVPFSDAVFIGSGGLSAAVKPSRGCCATR